MIQYIIHEMVEHDSLIQKRLFNTTFHSVLTEIHIDFVESRHKSMDDAFVEIVRQKNKLAGKKLTVIPVVCIDWEGEINIYR